MVLWQIEKLPRSFCAELVCTCTVNLMRESYISLKFVVRLLDLTIPVLCHEINPKLTEVPPFFSNILQMLVTSSWICVCSLHCYLSLSLSLFKDMHCLLVSVSNSHNVMQNLKRNKMGLGDQCLFLTSHLEHSSLLLHVLSSVDWHSSGTAQITCLDADQINCQKSSRVPVIRFCSYSWSVDTSLEVKCEALL